MNYTIQSGDTLLNIARKYYGEDNTYQMVSKIAEKNNIKDINLIFAGNDLILDDIPGDILELGSEKSNTINEKVRAYDDWTNINDEMQANSSFKIVDSYTDEDDLAQKTLDFAKEYVNVFGQNDGNIDFDEFFNNNQCVEKEDLQSIYKMIDIDGKDGITADEYASYLLTLDNSDGNLDGSIVLDNYNTVGAEVPVFADDKYANTSYHKMHEQSKQGLNIIEKLMKHFNDKFYSSKDEGLTH